ncbi:MAG: hypothetical protein AVDCRST_MAG74-841 [uncultured Pyrinomonadaceae bacterium]|uniref:DUF2382 domain-containing protein n=1 Tax=uncultured Pyrinomonadaceae bacterium TaxID=2283094 RepID=A0A6J4NMI7_9BACT|nr:MAG: hypothetical protein AVDCRST_MAG74-841 [uncultured Pyrinomonadaceae bacterium]
MTHTVVGLFDSKTEAQAAMRDLMAAGFAEEHIDFSNRRYDETTSGAATSNTTTGTTGGISGFFNSLFGDDSTEARNYTSVASDAEAILTVQTDSDERARQIADILDRNGAVDVDERAAQYQGNYAQSGSTTTENRTTQTGDMTQNRTAQTGDMTQNRTAATGDTTIPIIEEDLQVGKRQVQGGGVRVHSRVIEKPVEETVRLREEHVVVNRHPVDRAVTDADMASFKEGDIEITERSEQAVVSKQARVVEEVEIGKQVSEREQVVTDTVRRTDVDVEEIGTDVTTDANSRRANS